MSKIKSFFHLKIENKWEIMKKYTLYMLQVENHPKIGVHGKKNKKKFKKFRFLCDFM